VRQKPEIVNALRGLAMAGVLMPETVVEHARDPAIPLHDRFTWDDPEAPRQHRLAEARALIRVCVELLPGRRDPSPVFVSLAEDRVEAGGGYRLMVDVLSDSSRRAMLLAQAHAEMRSFAKKYAEIEELATVVAAAQQVLSKAA